MQNDCTHTASGAQLTLADEDEFITTAIVFAHKVARPAISGGRESYAVQFFVEVHLRSEIKAGAGCQRVEVSESCRKIFFFTYSTKSALCVELRHTNMIKTCK